MKMLKNAGSMFVYCSVIGRFTLSPGIYMVPGAMLNMYIFLFPFYVCLGGCNQFSGATLVFGRVHV